MKAALLLLALAIPAAERTPDDWFALVVSIQRSIEQADFEHRKIERIDAEDRKFVRKMVNELTVSPEARPTAMQGQWLLSIKAWIENAER